MECYWGNFQWLFDQRRGNLVRVSGDPSSSYRPSTVTNAVPYGNGYKKQSLPNSMTITVKYRIKDHEGAVSEDLLSWFIKSVEKCRNKFDCLLNLMLYIKQ